MFLLIFQIFIKSTRTMKIKKVVRKFKKLDKKIAALLPLQEAALSSETDADSAEELLKIDEKEEKLLKKRKKTLNRILDYALTH